MALSAPSEIVLLNAKIADGLGIRFISIFALTYPLLRPNSSPIIRDGSGFIPYFASASLYPNILSLFTDVFCRPCMHAILV